MLFRVDQEVIMFSILKNAKLPVLEESQIYSGEKSAVVSVVSDVPQCSVVGPLLFVIYIYDVVFEISPSNSYYLILCRRYCSIFHSSSTDIITAISIIIH